VIGLSPRRNAMEGESVAERAERDMKFIPAKREDLTRAIEAAGFIVTDIGMITKDRLPNEKPQIKFEVQGCIYVNMERQLTREEIALMNQPMVQTQVTDRSH
jgi:hypothetical protein